MVLARVLKPALALLLVVTGCSSGPSPATLRSTSPSPSASPCVARAAAISFPCPLAEVGTKDVTAQGLTVHLTIDAGTGAFDPTIVKARPGAKVVLRLSADITMHTFTIDALNIDQLIPANKDQTITLTLPSSGPVIFYCRPHRKYGMQGAIYFS